MFRPGQRAGRENSGSLDPAAGAVVTDLKALRTVYSYYLPEVREVVSRIASDYPHDIFLRSATTGLDDFHEAIIDRLVAEHTADIPSLGQFPSRYPTSGSEEGIREYMTQLAARG